MIDAPIETSFVSQVAPLGFADAADATERLSGRTISVEGATLEIGECVGDGLAGALWYSGVLRGQSFLSRPRPVDVVVSPWSAGRTEIGLRPLGRFTPTSRRARRFYQAAWSVLPSLIDQVVATRVPVAQPVEVRVAA